MKVLHITAFTQGGAGAACCRLHEGLLKCGVESKVMCLDKEDHKKGIYSLPKLPFFKRLLSRFFHVFQTERHKSVRLNKKLNNMANEEFYYSTPFSDFDVTKSPLYQEADIIHLHWISYIIDYNKFFKQTNKTIFWTFHDLNPISGGLHFPINGNINNLTNGLDLKFKSIKNESLSLVKRLNIICLSTSMKEEVENEICLKYSSKFIVHNGVESEVFLQQNKQENKRLLNLPLDKKIMLFVSYHLFEKRKGLNVLLEALKMCNNSDISLVLVGKVLNEEEKESIKNYIHFDATSDRYLLAKYYSAADLFVSCSKYEAFSQTPIEAILSGTPVVMTPVSGASDLVNANNGVICEDFTELSLSKAITKAISKDYNSQMIKDDAKSKFDILVIANQISKLYNESLK